MKYTHVIWDFNGTVLDDVKIGIESVNTLLKRRKLKTLESVEEYRSVFGFPIIEYYKRIGFDFSKEDFSAVAREWVDEYMKNVVRAKAVCGVIGVIEKLKKCGLSQVLVSATEINMLKKQLDMLGISELFDGIYGLDNIHAQNKVSTAMEWRKQNPNAKAIVVGDTDHDFETSVSIGADCVLCCSGHQPKSELLKLGVPVIDSVLELESFLY